MKFRESLDRSVYAEDPEEQQDGQGEPGPPLADTDYEVGEPSGNKQERYANTGIQWVASLLAVSDE